MALAGGPDPSAPIQVVFEPAECYGLLPRMGLLTMFGDLATRRLFRTAAPLYLALLLLVLSLLISLAGGWTFYTLFRETKEDELGRRLIAFAQAAERGIADRAEFAMVEMLESDLDDADDEGWEKEFQDLLTVYKDGFERLQDGIRSLLENPHAGLRSVLLISPQGRVIADASGRIPPGTRAPFLTVDRYAWAAALGGRPESLLAYRYEGALYKRVYAPVRILASEEFSDRVGAVLQLEPGLGAFSETDNLRTQGLILAGIVTLLMLGVALLFLRLMRLLVEMGDRAAHQDRLQAMGSLAAGIAHEIRNPLGIIRTLAEGMAGNLESEDSRREMLADIIDEVERLNRLVTQYLAFARPDPASPEDGASPGDVIRSLAPLFEKGSDRSAVTIEAKIADDLPKVRMNESALRQVLLNLLLNARDASQENGLITVRCAPVRGGSQVEIVVEDRGAGIPKRDLRRIFDPFFTTKAGGSGLGLAICRQLVTECRGTVDVSSKPGQGTAVRIALPAQGSSR